MKLTPKFAFVGAVLIWILAVLPFFIPALNTIEPKVLGLPFVTAWQYGCLVLHILLVVICRYKVWDPFDANENKEGADQ